jgi:hypothetical protein
VRTPQELEDALSADLAWRRVEMQSLRSQVRAARGATQDALLRAGLALLYAHWEGYCKHSLTLYLKFVARRKLKLRELRPGFAALAVDSAIRKQGGLSEARRRMSTVTILMDRLDERLYIPSKEVNTQSNLSSEVCSELLETLGLDFAPFSTKAHLIDYKLLRARNEIAHGRWSPVDLEAYEELHSEVLVMLQTVRNLVTAAADNGEYRRVAT